MYMNRAAKRLLYLGAAVSLCLSMGWGAADAADLAGAPHEVVTAEQEMVLAAPQVILNPNIRYANAARTPYEAKVWRLDAPVGEKFPVNFRSTSDPFVKKHAGEKMYQGLEALHISGSAQPSADGFRGLIKEIRKHTNGPIYDIDLKQETHGFANGEAVSRYGMRNWGNVGKSLDQILADENRTFAFLPGKTILISPPGARVREDRLQPLTVSEASTEKELTRELGIRYVRIPATDHIWPDPDTIDQMIALYRRLPKDSWLHFHCEAGKGRTTAFMAMYDMMRNPQLPMETILERQHAIGGNIVNYEGNGTNQWKNPYYKEKARMIKAFYEYVQQNHKTGYRMKWSEWLSKREAKTGPQRLK